MIRRGERLAYAYLAGIVTGLGIAGFWWMNPYIALSLVLGGYVLCAVVITAGREQ